MSVEWGGSGVRVVGLAPGPIADTEGMRRLGGSRSNEEVNAHKASIPLRCYGSRLHMGHSALFLVSEAAAYVTGGDKSRI